MQSFAIVFLVMLRCRVNDKVGDIVAQDITFSSEQLEEFLDIVR